MKPGPKPRPAEEVLSATIGVSVTADTRESLHSEAAKRGITLAAMIRLALKEYVKARKR